ncbi:helix-turn-helix domain-containing protein [Faecalibacter bovis]|uniref:helix-turn-helix domain-containing protein n=1 Tax=Faecalibacter bovis TaxID=2898187 RepID=UPI003742FB09
MTEVKNLLSKTRKTLYSWHEKGILTFFKIGGQNYYKTEDVLNLLYINTEATTN